MELVTLNSDYQPENPIENYESLLWTERYSASGDFILVSQNVQEAINDLPKESFVSLRDSNVLMVVEDHKIEKRARSAPVVTITGRAFETVLERRASVNSLPNSTSRTAWTITAEKESDAAYKAMRIVLGDVARSQNGSEVLAALSPAVSPYDAISEIDLILPADYSSLVPNTYEIKPTDLYSMVMEMISANHHGLKSFRPTLGGTKIGVEIYNGADLTESVVFDANFDQMEDSTYLLSNRGSTNVAYVYGPNGSQSVLKTTAPEPTGLSRRVLLLDETSDETINTTDIRKSRGLIELYKYNATALFDGQVAEQVAMGYNKDYFLGDIVKLMGEYGLSQNVRVAEFIRSSDNSGEKAFPAFESVS